MKTKNGIADIFHKRGYHENTSLGYVESLKRDIDTMKDISDLFEDVFVKKEDLEKLIQNYKNKLYGAIIAGLLIFTSLEYKENIINIFKAIYKQIL